jgi:hypothetical protein
MFIALCLLLIVAIMVSIFEGRTHARLARTTVPALSVCRYCGEPAPHYDAFPLCADCEAAEAEYLTGNHHNI